MNRRTVLRLAVCVLVAWSAGCTSLRRSRPQTQIDHEKTIAVDQSPQPSQANRSPKPIRPTFGKSHRDPLDKQSTGVASTGVAAAEAKSTEPVPEGIRSAPVKQASLPDSQPLPKPRPLQESQNPPQGAGEPFALPNLPPPSGDPHVRPSPTVKGSRLNLGPNETPIERVLELARQLEIALAQNRDLMARIVELEQQGIGREQALKEAIREVEKAEEEIAKVRGTLSSHKAEIASLQSKLQQLEREDIELFKLMIAALEKLLPPGRREP